VNQSVNQRSRATAIAAAAVASALFSAPASAQWWWPPTGGLSVTPSCLDPSTSITLTVSGDWPDACRPNLSSAQVSGNEIDFFTVRDPPPTFCLTVITPWSLSETIDPIPAGAYTVFVTHLVAGQVVHPRTQLGTIDVVASCPGACYANCDESTAAPILNVNDFVCFQQRFAAGDSYANCDNSTAPPILNVNDFVCFQQSFAAGCP
jgi:hypothetical protein